MSTGDETGIVRYSLIIATLNDSGDLTDCLNSLVDQQGAPEFEVIVVDQNEDDRLADVISGFSSSLRIVHQRVEFRGASRARNVGARLANGAWLGFPDDDCRLLPDALRQVHLSAVDRFVRVITGQTIDADGAPNVLRWAQEPVSFTRWTMFRCLTEATMFVDREAFLAVGGFDERFGPGARYPAAEGIDVMNRLFLKFPDMRALYNPAIKMRHPTKIPPFNRWAAGRFHAYAIGDGALIAKNPQFHMLNWGLRTIVSASLQTISLEGWRSAAFAARLLGLLRGFVTFNLRRLACAD